MISTADLVAWTKAVSGEESILRSLEAAAVDYVIRISGRNYGLSRQIVEEFTWRGGVLPLGDVPTSLTVQTWDGTAWQDVGASDYRVSGRLVYLSGAYDAAGTPVRATYTAGYTPAAAPADQNEWAAPDTVKHAVRMLVAHWYVNREAGVVGVTSDEVAAGVRMLLQAV